MSDKLVKFISNSGDEYDVDGFDVITENEFNHFFLRLDNATKLKNPHFGSNSTLDILSPFDTNIKDQIEIVKDSYEILDITRDEYYILKRLFNTPYGDYYSPNEFIEK